MRVDAEDAHRTPPPFNVLQDNYWQTPVPKPNELKRPKPHPVAQQDGTRARQAPDRLGMGSICADNAEHFMECEYSCTHHAPVARRLSTSFMLKYHDGKQWALHATHGYQPDEVIGEYVGEMLSKSEGARRKQAKIATSPSYLLQVGDRYINAEQHGNAL